MTKRDNRVISKCALFTIKDKNGVLFEGFRQSEVLKSKAPYYVRKTDQRGLMDFKYGLKSEQAAKDHVSKWAAK